MRAVLPPPLCLTPAALDGARCRDALRRVVDHARHERTRRSASNRRELGARLVDGARDAEIGELRHGEPGIAAGIDVGEGREIHATLTARP